MTDEKQSAPSDPDWSPDNFRTSAKPVFRSIGLLVATIIVLCYLAYRCSPHPEEFSPLEDVGEIQETPTQGGELEGGENAPTCERVEDFATDF